MRVYMEPQTLTTPIKHLHDMDISNKLQTLQVRASVKFSHDLTLSRTTYDSEFSWYMWLQAAMPAESKHAESAEKRARDAEAAVEAFVSQGMSASEVLLLKKQVADVSAERDEAVMAKDRAMNMLAALKKQIAEAEMDEEEKLTWRVEAEVRLALEEFKRTEVLQGASVFEARGRVEKELASERQLRQNLESQLLEWRTAFELKEIELQNLHLALGELSYNSEVGLKVIIY